MNNKEITKQVITNNIIGSFFVVMWRERDNKGIMEFIDPLRISVYHHVIIKENTKYTFPDIMEPSDSCDGSEYHFNNLDNKYGDDCDYWQSKSDIKKEKLTPEEVYNTYVEILENKSLALLNSKINLYKKLCHYKILVMRGMSLPIYGMKVVHNRIKKFDLLSGDDILKDYKLSRKFLRHTKNNL